ncbi:hypothetical protein NQ176_g4164 [Zarea fungicola]|uniref:Uncharacterized protein n=1 Tax=Zarea fungicola TaxID=93591 RepID=A0ACC1NFZ2_9HYPO|nr:hypothetical protein NQ176_g4164 [Lecanicillium fungicola]
MVKLYSQALSAVALWAACVHGKKLYLDFEDLPASNAQGCGANSVSVNAAYHDLAISNNFGDLPVRVLNTTKTAKCSTSSIGLFDQKRATSGPNVLVGNSGELDFQIFSDNDMLINDASFDISFQFTAAERANKDNIVTVNTLQADFAVFSVEKQFTFHTAKDGFGPYHIVAPNTGKYVFLTVEGSVGVPGTASFRKPTVFMDSVSLETTAK